MREYQACPLAVDIRTPLPYADPERRGVWAEENYGLVVVDPAASPRTMTVELRGRNGLLAREVIRAEEPASVRVACDLPEASFAMEGPVLFRNSNTLVVRPSLEPGRYAVTFGAVPGIPTLPTPIDLDVREGSDLRLGARWRDVPDTQHPVLLDESFETPLSGFTIRDEGTISGPSAWFTSHGYLQQSSNIYGGSTTGPDPVKPGTMALTGSAAWKDYTLTVKVRSKDDDAVGVIFRHTDDRNYYRFSMSLQHDYLRLTKTVDGAVSTVAERAGSYLQHAMQEVRIAAIGPLLTLWLGGAKVLEATDGSHAAGRVGLYTWGNFLTEFDDLVVRSGDVPPVTASRFPGALFEDRFGDGQLQGWTVSDQGTISAPSRWTEAGGALVQLSNIYGGPLSGSVVPKPGTMAVVAKTLPSDLYFETWMQNPDNDGMGVVFRYRDADNHYRFSWDSERSYRRLAKVVNGTWVVLQEDAVGYAPDRNYRVGVQVEGTRIRVCIDGAVWADRGDASHATGTVGLYAWGSQGLRFDDVLCLVPQRDPRADPRKTGGLTLRPVLASRLQAKVTDLIGRHPDSAGDDYFLALAFARTPGIPLSLLNPADLRTLELAPDALLLLSLQGHPIFSGFRGTVDKDGYFGAQIHWPKLPGTSGAVIYCSGWIEKKDTATITEVLPTVEVVLP